MNVSLICHSVGEDTISLSIRENIMVINRRCSEKRPCSCKILGKVRGGTQIFFVLSIVVFGCGMAQASPDCPPRPKGEAGCAGGVTSRPNIFGGYDYSNGVTSRKNTFGGYDYSNGVHSRKNSFGGEDYSNGDNSRSNPFGGHDYNSGNNSRSNIFGGRDYKSGTSCRKNIFGGQDCQ